MIVNPVLLLIILLFKSCHDKVTLQKLNDYSAESLEPFKPINQVLSSSNDKDKNGITFMHVFLGTRSFSYTDASTNYVPNKFDSKDYLSLESSVKISKISDTRIAISGGKKDIELIDEAGKLKASYTTENERGNCAFFQLINNQYFYGYHDIILSQFNLNILILNEIDKTFTNSGKSNSMASGDNGYFSCLYLSQLKIIFCSYMKDNEVIGRLYNENISQIIPDSSINGDISLGQIDNYPLILSIDSKTLYVVAIFKGKMIGNSFSYNSSTKTLDKNLYFALDITSSFNSWDIISINHIDGEQNPVPMLLIAYCDSLICNIQKYTTAFQPFADPIKIPITTIGADINTRINLSLFNNWKVSIIISQTKTNWLLAYDFPNCLMLVKIKYQSGKLFFSSIQSLFKNIKISFGQSSELKYITLSGGQQVIANTFYPFSSIVMTFPIADILFFNYRFQNEENQFVSDCLLTVLICNIYCDTCTKYSDSKTDMKCIKCKDEYYSSTEKIGQCYTKEDCIKSSWFINDDTHECVSSCANSGYLFDKEKSLCVTECNNDQTLNKISSECVLHEELKTMIDSYIKHIDEYINELYKYYPLILKTNEIMSIYNTSILPKEAALEGIKNGPYEIVYISSVRLGECEKYLKEYYELDMSSPLIIAKVDTVSDKQLSAVVDFKVYSNKGKRLDVSLCYGANLTVNIISPINPNSTEFITGKKYQNKGIDAYNTEDSFFNDLCYPYTTDYYTDIPLPNRVEDILLDESLLCNPPCNYISVDYEKKSVICSCSKEAAHLYKQKHDSLLESFSSFWVSSNFAVINCYNLVFDGQRFANNLGSWFILLLILIEIVSAIYYFTYGYQNIEKIMIKLELATKNKLSDSGIFCLKNDSLNNGNEINSSPNKNFVLTPKNNSSLKLASPPKRTRVIQTSHHNSTQEIKHSQFNNFITPQSTSFNRPLKIQKDYSKKNQSGVIDGNNTAKTNNLKNNPDNGDHNKKDKTMNFHIVINQQKDNIPKNRKEEDKPNKPILQLKKMENDQSMSQVHIVTNNTELKTDQIQAPEILNFLNELGNKPNLQIKMSLKNFGYFYWIFLQHVHVFIRSFFTVDVYKTRVVNISLFFFFVSLSFTLNAFFFSIKHVSKSYSTQGQLNFFFNLPKMVYSFLFSYVFKLLFNMLSSVTSVIMRLIQKKEINTKKILISRLRWKLSMFYCLKLILLAFFWYYVAAFCAVYPNIQMTWVISSLTSFLMEMLIPFVFALLLTFMLIISAKYNIKWFIKFSNNFVVH